MTSLVVESNESTFVPACNPVPERTAPTNNPSTDFKVISFSPATKEVSTKRFLFIAAIALTLVPSFIPPPETTASTYKPSIVAKYNTSAS